MFNNKPKQNVNELALEYLERKYCEKFEYVQPAGNSMTGTRNFIASCAHGHVLVQVDNFKDEDARVFRDNHIAVKYEEKMRNFIKEISDKEFTESKAFYDAPEHALSEDLPGDATFEQFLADPETSISAVIAVKYSDYSDNDQLKAIVEAISASSAAQRINLHIHMVEDSEFITFDNHTHDETILAKKYIKYAHFYRENNTMRLEIFSRGGVLDERIEY